MEGNIKLVPADPVPDLQKGDILYRQTEYSRRIIKYVVKRVTHTQAIVVEEGGSYEQKVKRSGVAVQNGNVIVHKYPPIADGYTKYEAPNYLIEAEFTLQDAKYKAETAFYNAIKEINDQHLTINRMQEAFGRASHAMRKLTDAMMQIKNTKQ